MNDLLEYISDRSIDLDEMGVNNFALLKQDALQLIEKFKKNNILLYGGDFIIKENGKLNYNYTNWSTNGRDIESNLNYAKAFIGKYATDNTYIEFITEKDLYKLLQEYKKDI
jgi:hypothetical protein